MWGLGVYRVEPLKIKDLNCSLAFQLPLDSESDTIGHTPGCRPASVTIFTGKKQNKQTKKYVDTKGLDSGIWAQ